MLYKTILEPQTFALLESIMQNPAFDSFALTAGTALALRLNHRYSDDLDLWTQDVAFLYGGEVREAVEKEIRHLIPCQHRINHPLRSVFVVNDTFKIDFILDQTKAITPIDKQENIRMFSLQDIAALKIDAVAGYKPRHDKKDFFDIYTLLTLNIFSLKEMFEFFQKREGESNFFDALKNFLYNMELADLSKNPRLTGGQFFDWQMIKNELKEAVRNCVNLA